MADIERKLAPEPEVNPFRKRTSAPLNSHSDGYATVKQGTIVGTRDMDAFNAAVRHLVGGQYGVSYNNNDRI